MLGKNDKVLYINNTITPGHRANVTQRLIRAPIINHDAHVSGVNNSVAVEIEDRHNGDFLPALPAP